MTIAFLSRKAALEDIIYTMGLVKTKLLTDFTDKSLSLEERWELFRIATEAYLLSNESYDDFRLDIIDPNLSLYDDFYMEKYATKTYIDVYDMMKDSHYVERYGQETIDTWREDVLSRGMGSGTYD